MATAGSGDTLTGIIAALMGSGYKPFEASVIGVYIHGLAGDLAADEKGQISLIASDITNYLSDAYLFIYDDFPDEYLPNEDVDV
jgi:NAD(P)H-hydrate epimerase